MEVLRAGAILLGSALLAVLGCAATIPPDNHNALIGAAFAWFIGIIGGLALMNRPSD